MRFFQWARGERTLMALAVLFFIGPDTIISMAPGMSIGDLQLRISKLILEELESLIQVPNGREIDFAIAKENDQI